MIELSRKDIGRILDWYRVTRTQKLDVLADEELARKLHAAELRAYEQERTR